MALIDLFRRTPPPAPEAKASSTAAIMVGSGVAQWSARDYKAYAKEGYGQNPIVFSAVSKIAEAVAALPIEGWSGDKEMETAPALDLLRDPSPIQSRGKLIEEIVSYLYLSGDAFVEGVSASGMPVEMYALRPDRVGVLPGNAGFPAKFTFENNGRKVAFDVDQTTGKSDLLQIKMFDPMNDWRGQSPIDACAREVDIHNAASKWLKALLDNSAQPSGALTLAADGDLTDEQFNRLKEQVEEQYSGADNAGRPMLLEGGMSWQAMGLAPNQVGIIEIKNAAARNICLTLGVPPQLLGIPGDNTYSNYQVAREAFYEDTVIPVAKMLYESLTSWLALFGSDIELRPSFDDTPAMVRQRAEKWTMADASTELTVDEKRKMKGFEPLPGGAGDVVLIASSQIPLSAAGLGLGEPPLAEDADDPKDPA